MTQKSRKYPPETRQKRPDAAKNAKPKVKYLTHGGGNGLLKDPLDARTAIGKAYQADINELAIHVGGSPSLPQQNIIDQAVRLNLLSKIAWGELIRSGLIQTGQVSPAFEAFISATRNERETLKLLGLKRQAEKVQTLKDILDGDRDHEKS